MPANPHAYDDLPQVYAEEISAHHRGVLRILRHCAGTYVFDRCNNRRPSLAEIEYQVVTIIEQDVSVGNSDDLFDTTRSRTVRKSVEAARRAGRRGGAATKARWARLKAAAPEHRKAA